MLDIIQKRFSVRSYTNQKVDTSLLEKVLIAAQYAPTWKNKQCFEIIVIDDRSMQQQIGELTKFNPSESAYQLASHLLVFLADPQKSGLRDDKPYYMCDSAIAITHCMLEATALGIGTCWVGVFPEDEIKSLLGIPEALRIVAMSPLGYTQETYQKRPRRPLDAFLHKNKY